MRWAALTTGMSGTASALNTLIIDTRISTLVQVINTRISTLVHGITTLCEIPEDQFRHGIADRVEKRGHVERRRRIGHVVGPCRQDASQWSTSASRTRGHATMR